jgi:hypothetical protein
MNFISLNSNWKFELNKSIGKKEALLCSKNIQTLHAARIEYCEQLSSVGRFQILNRIHVINFGT